MSFNLPIVTLLLALATISSEAQPAPDLSVLGTNDWTRFRPGWSLTVNDQCLYEFVFQFEHDDTLPIGNRNFQDKCTFQDPQTKLPLVADDGNFYLKTRQFWDRFPDYVWATIGFNHLSIDWNPCGHRPRGYSLPHYDFSFFRVTPEFRAHTMVCDLLVDDQVIVPGEEICAFQQENVEGMGFFIVPGALVNRNPVVNMPESFRRPALGNGPIPHAGLRSWDQVKIPDTPNQWNGVDIFMSSYAGDLVMWQAQVPYRLISGDKDQFNSFAYRYFETTVNTLPDTFAFDYDVIEEKGTVRLHMVGKSNLCRPAFEKAQAAAGGPPVFPNYDVLLETEQSGEVEGGETGESEESADGGENNSKPPKKSGAPAVPSVLPVTLSLFALLSAALLL